MSPAYTTPEQRDRWHKRDCARCGRHGWFAARWPDGHVCRTCHDKALRVRGHCPGCCDERVLPGLRTDDGSPVCSDCAGFMMSYRCSRCGGEGKLHRGRLCTHCTLADRVAGLLDDGTGRIWSELAPLADALLSMDNPISGLTWLYTRKGHPDSPENLLRRLGRGEIELTHDAFHTLQPWRAAAHLRELLMDCGVLPTIDKRVCLFERWLADHLAGITNPQQAQLVRRFATWEVLPRLRTSADRRALTPSSTRYAADQVKHATMLLRWLDDQGRDLATCGQADICRRTPYVGQGRTKKRPQVSVRGHQVGCSVEFVASTGDAAQRRVLRRPGAADLTRWGGRR
ncbi:hypothetical protein OG216_47020 (plasmid) [Streptomycetaceae bacterium NBC_01309]